MLNNTSMEKLFAMPGASIEIIIFHAGNTWIRVDFGMEKNINDAQIFFDHALFFFV